MTTNVITYPHNTFGIQFPALMTQFFEVCPPGSATGITTKTHVLTTCPAPKPGYYLVNAKGVITAASGLNNNNIHFIVSQTTTPDPSKFDSFAFQSMSEWNNGTTILAVSVCDIVKIEGTTPLSIYLFDTQASGGETYDFTYSSVKLTPVSCVQRY